MIEPGRLQGEGLAAGFSASKYISGRGQV